MAKQIVYIGIKQKTKSFQSVRIFVPLCFGGSLGFFSLGFFSFLWYVKAIPYKYYKEISVNHYFSSTCIRRLAWLRWLEHMDWKQEESIDIAQAYRDGIRKAEAPLGLSRKPQIDQAMSSLVWPQSYPCFGQSIGLKTSEIGTSLHYFDQPDYFYLLLASARPLSMIWYHGFRAGVQLHICTVNRKS